MISIKMTGTEELMKQLIKMSAITFEHSANDSLAEMFNRGSRPPYTPIDTGELRLSRKVTKASATKKFTGVFGYNKDYAPHVEYGHRLKGGGFVMGQYFLRANVEVQRPIFKGRLVDEIRRSGR